MTPTETLIQILKTRIVKYLTAQKEVFDARAMSQEFKPDLRSFISAFRSTSNFTLSPAGAIGSSIEILGNLAIFSRNLWNYFLSSDYKINIIDVIRYSHDINDATFQIIATTVAEIISVRYRKVIDNLDENGAVEEFSDYLYGNIEIYLNSKIFFLHLIQIYNLWKNEPLKINSNFPVCVMLAGSYNGYFMRNEYSNDTTRLKSDKKEDEYVITLHYHNIFRRIFFDEHREICLIRTTDFFEGDSINKDGIYLIAHKFSPLELFISGLDPALYEPIGQDSRLKISGISLFVLVNIDCAVIYTSTMPSNFSEVLGESSYIYIIVNNERLFYVERYSIDNMVEFENITPEDLDKIRNIVPEDKSRISLLEHQSILKVVQTFQERSNIRTSVETEETSWVNVDVGEQTFSDRDNAPVAAPSRAAPIP